MVKINIISNLFRLKAQIIFLSVFTFLGAGCPTVPSAPTTAPITETAARAVNMSPTEVLMKKKDDMMKVKADGSMATLTETMTLADGTKVMPSGEIMKPAGEKKMMADGESVTMEGEVVKMASPKEEPPSTLVEEKKQLMRPGSYEAYAPEKLASANNGTVVLFVHAAWCPTGRAANSNFEAAPFPEGLTILKVDYDAATDLKRKYGITYQHTYVHVDAKGNLIKKWSRSTILDEILRELNG